MKLDKEDIAEITELIAEAESFKPIAQLVLNGLKLFGPEIKDLLSTIVNGIDDIAIDRFKKFIDAGFSREESMLMILSTTVALEQLPKKLTK